MRRKLLLLILSLGIVTGASLAADGSLLPASSWKRQPSTVPPPIGAMPVSPILMTTYAIALRHDAGYYI